MAAPGLGFTDAIRFRHPGYPRPANTLLRLPRVDSASSRQLSILGVHHRTALVACQVVANNAFNGRLFFDADGRRSVEESIPLDGVLQDSDYWFFVDGEGNVACKLSDPSPRSVKLTAKTCFEDRYPVVPSFEDWQFPHDRIPEVWRKPGLLVEALYTSPEQPTPPGQPRPEQRLAFPPPVVFSPDPVGMDFGAAQQRCAVTMSSYGVTSAHIVPRESGNWFRTNGMRDYNLELAGVDTEDRGNLFSLRADLHDEFDKRVFCIVPKPASPLLEGASRSGQAAPDSEHGVRDASLPRQAGQQVEREQQQEILESGRMRQELQTSPRQQQPQQQYVVHLFRSPESSQFGEMHDAFHNRPLSNLSSFSSVRREFLFARFAWCVLLFVKDFITAGVERRVVMLGAVGGEAAGEAARATGPGATIRVLSGEELINKYGGGGSKRSSPKKRGRGSGEREDGATDNDDDKDRESDVSDGGTDDDELTEPDYWSQDLEWNNRWYAKMMREAKVDEEERTRGRKRRRTQSTDDTQLLASAHVRMPLSREPDGLL